MGKRNGWLALATYIVVLVTLVGFISGKKTVKPMQYYSQNGFAVVELFTSEGCSSCPAADETVARLLAKNTANVYILAYHVDYWDRLGWKDPFSKSAFSQRQNEYAAVFDLSSVYTPQVIVNGASQFIGSDEQKLNTTVEKNLAQEPTGHIIIDTKRNDKHVTVNYYINENCTVLLNFALVQPEATTIVNRGENGGRTLHHVNVVRTLKTIDAKGKGSVTMEVPTELTGIPLRIIAFTQAKKSFKILAAEQKSL